MLSNTLIRRIEWGDCDPAGIVFNPNYFRYADHCTTMLYEAAGLPKHAMLDRYGIAGCPLVDTHASFLAPCRYGDELTIVSGFAETGRSSFRIRHEMTRGKTLCTVVEEKRVWTSRDPQTGKLKSAPMPADVVARFQGRTVA